jgi:hypothetical protein
VREREGGEKSFNQHRKRAYEHFNKLTLTNLTLSLIKRIISTNEHSTYKHISKSTLRSLSWSLAAIVVMGCNISGWDFTMILHFDTHDLSRGVMT